jgi:phosphatidylglycerophosphatase A
VTVLGSGYLPLAPGTWGSLVAVLAFAVIWWLVAAAGLPRAVVEGILVAGVVSSSWFSVRFGGWAIARFGRSDPKPFVLDEFAGQWVALIGLPVAYGAGGWMVACVAGAAFFLFRVFDVIKPPPARQAERLPAGWGILLDDLFAGLYANVLGQVVWRLTPLAAWLGA